jgi:hypothetical protein
MSEGWIPKETTMKQFLFAAAAIGTLMAAAPASAQVYFGGDRSGVEFGVGPRDHEWRDHEWGDHGWRGRGWRSYGYASECRIVRERIETSRGRVIFRTHRECD